MRVNWDAARERAEEYFTKACSGKVRVTSSLLKYILLWHGDSTFYQGRMVHLKKRNMGAGVYEIWMEEV